jgi:hypothetical protein
MMDRVPGYGLFDQIATIVDHLQAANFVAKRRPGREHAFATVAEHNTHRLIVAVLAAAVSLLEITAAARAILFILDDGPCRERLASTKTSCDEIRGYDLNDLYDQNFARIVCQAKCQFLERLQNAQQRRKAAAGFV